MTIHNITHNPLSHIGALGRSALLALTLLAGGTSAMSQVNEPVVVQPLFEYPVPPEEMTELSQRSEWVLTHFWDSMDFKSKSTVDQNALNHAFGVYSLAMQWGSQQTVEASTRNLLKKLAKNPTLLTQFTKAAEENLYGPRARLWVDDIYAEYLRAAIANKKIDKSRKVRYESQLKRLENSRIGSIPIAFKFKFADGREGSYFPMATPTVIEFGYPDCLDCRLSRLRMETNVSFSRLIDQGKVNMLFIIPDPEEGWEKEVSDYSDKWTVGAAKNLDTVYDLRTTPSFYVIDAKGHIVAKNIDADEAVKTVMTLIE